MGRIRAVAGQSPVAQALWAVQGCSIQSAQAGVPVLPEPMTHPRSLRLCSGQAGQVREDGVPGRALSGTAEDGGPFKLKGSSSQGTASSGRDCRNTLSAGDALDGLAMLLPRTPLPDRGAPPFD